MNALFVVLYFRAKKEICEDAIIGYKTEMIGEKIFILFVFNYNTNPLELLKLVKEFWDDYNFYKHIF